ncbi:aminotransferase class V-fold PLP-dependent enzyme [Aeropyrum camini]|uniref:cysteine desulfurase n=1 Tax=Aeropyrum camini SY1 = JCM 12091 TaxID=1198449 RepID=U3TB31_9CREN|nr:cysteine desulfurase [Aeropyrum camini]BAN90742.1 cysteine desulfurase [Aeropyrum camini SY1 = JCM 12091]
MPGLSCYELRSEFPELERGVVYLDNAASTLKPRRVVEAMREFSYRSYANVHRGVHRLSIEASKAYEEAQDVVARLVGGSWDEVVFTRNTTEAMQLAALTLAYNGLLRGGEVLVTAGDHHSTLLPWVRAARLGGGRARILPLDGRGVPRWDLLDDYVTEDTRVVAVGHVSNVTGAVAPVEDVVRAARRVSALVVLDSAQGVPHLPVDFRRMGVDMAAFSGHKMLGPTGIGVLWARRDLLEELEPPLGGGGTVSRVRLKGGSVEIEWEEPPWKFEAGTPPIIEAVGLAEAAEMLMEIGMERVAEHEDELTGYTMKLLEPLYREGLIRYVGPDNPGERHGIVSITTHLKSPDELGLLLDRKGIAVRTGLHCAHILHDHVGASTGSVRASFYIYNCKEDAERLAEALEEILTTRR